MNAEEQKIAENLFFCFNWLLFQILFVFLRHKNNETIKFDAYLITIMNMKNVISTTKAPAAIGPQTRQSLLNVKAILEAAGLTMSDVVKTTVFMADMNDFADMNAVYAEFFSEPYPARSAVAVKALPKGALVEIEVVAGV